MTPKEKEGEALAATAAALLDVIATVLPRDHAVLLIVVPRRRCVDSFVTAAMPALDEDSLGSALSQIAASVTKNRATFSRKAPGAKH